MEVFGTMATLGMWEYNTGNCRGPYSTLLALETLLPRKHLQDRMNPMFNKEVLQLHGKRCPNLARR